MSPFHVFFTIDQTRNEGFGWVAAVLPIDHGISEWKISKKISKKIKRPRHIFLYHILAWQSIRSSIIEYSYKWILLELHFVKTKNLGAPHRNVFWQGTPPWSTLCRVCIIKEITLKYSTWNPKLHWKLRHRLYRRIIMTSLFRKIKYKIRSLRFIVSHRSSHNYCICYAFVSELELRLGNWNWKNLSMSYIVIMSSGWPRQCQKEII